MKRNKAFVCHPDSCSVLWRNDCTCLLSTLIFESVFFFQIHEVEVKMTSSGGWEKIKLTFVFNRAQCVRFVVGPPGWKGGEVNYSSVILCFLQSQELLLLMCLQTFVFGSTFDLMRHCQVEQLISSLLTTQCISQSTQRLLKWTWVIKWPIISDNRATKRRKWQQVFKKSFSQTQSCETTVTW